MSQVGYHFDEPVRLPRESYGTCMHCRREAVLGDGQCVDCWDKKFAMSRGLAEDVATRRGVTMTSVYRQRRNHDSSY